jgi:superoxide reductase
MAKFLGSQDGAIVGVISEGKTVLESGGVPLQELAVHTSSEEGNEKHTPLVHEEDGRVYVKVSSTLHPMDPDHYIDWVYLLTDKGAQRKVLHPGQAPEVIFLIGEDEVVLDVEAHCTRHGLWQADLD